MNQLKNKVENPYHCRKVSQLNSQQDHYGLELLEEAKLSDSSSSSSFEESFDESDQEELNINEEADFLVVDDNMLNLFTLKAILKNTFKRAKVELAYNG